MCTVHVQLPKPMHAELTALAREHERSMSAEIRHVLRKHLADHNGVTGHSNHT